MTIADTRYDENQIVSHNLDKEGCYSTTHLLPFLETKPYEDHHVFFIEEAQFFPDLLQFVSRAVDIDFKHVIVCGLDGDYQRRPIGQVVKGNPTAANSARAQVFLGQTYSFGLGSVDDYSNLEPDLRVILRKLSKKDSITKSKALEELLAYFNQNAVQDDAAAAWAGLFPKLATDIDRKVRELCFAVHLKLTVFPPNTNKGEQVLVYCLNEIQEYLTSNLLYQSAETLGDSRFATKDEMEAKYRRVISGSIDGLGFLVEKLNADKRGQSLETILSSKAFWAFSTNISSHIRGAMYRFISTLTKNGQDIIANYEDLIATQFLAKVFNDKESVAYSYMWEAILLLSKNNPQLWIKASEKKSVLPKVLQFLKSGAHGSGKQSYPCLLPLLGLFPTQLTSEIPDFFVEFFGSFWQGHGLIDRNSSESYMEAYYECLLYMLKKDVDKRKELLTKHLFGPLEALFHGKSGKILHEDLITSFICTFKSVWSLASDDEKDLIKIYTIALLENVVNPKVENNDLQPANVSLGDFLNRLEFSHYINNSLINILVFLLCSCEDEEKVETMLRFLLMLIPIGKVTDDNIELLLDFANKSQYLDIEKFYIVGIQTVVETILKCGSQFKEKMTQVWGELLRNVSEKNDINLFNNAFAKLTEFIVNGRAKLMTLESETVTLDPNVVLKLLFALNVFNGISKLADPRLLDSLFEVTELAHCKPLSVVKFSWTASLPPGTSEFAIFESIFSEANALIANLAAQDSADLNAIVPKNLERWVKESFKDQYCCSASDCISIVKTLIGFANDDEQSMLVEIILDSKETWIKLFSQFNNFYDDSVELQNSIHSWRTIREKQDQQIYYDFDGLSHYAKRGVIYCTLLKDASIGAFFKKPWILIELERIKQTCIYTKYTPHSLFSVDSPIQSDHLIKDIDELMEFVLRKVPENSIELLFADIESKSTVGTDNLLLDSFSNANSDLKFSDIAPDSQDLKISNCEVFSSLLTKYLNINPQPSIALVALLNSIIATDATVLGSAAITSIVPFIKSRMELTLIFKKLLKPVLDIKKNDIVSNAFSSRKAITLLFHFLYPNMEPLEEPLFDEQDQKSFIRWVRTMYDAHISQPVKPRRERQSDSILLDAHIIAILSFFINEITKEAFDLGINMNRFVVDLAVHLFREFAESDITPAVGVHLYYSLQFWDALEFASNEDEEAWIKVGDVRNEIGLSILNIFIDTCHPDKADLAGFPVLQTKLSSFVSQLDLADHFDELESQEQMANFQVNAYKILQLIVAKEVERKSLQMEMNTSDEAVVIELNNYLRSNLLKAVDPNLTFELRQQYINHIRSLDIFNEFLEMIFDLLNVGTLLPIFDLSNWDIEEFMIEYFDKSSSTAISLMCSHLYLRALKSVPTLIRIWFTECKNRQLVLGVESFTEKCFSKILIANECASLQTHSDDDFSVKFNSNSHEITAAYKFEEAELDIVIKLPPCYPLKLIDISAGTAGGRQAGISEARWRGWLLSITSVITGQNGTVSDAIYLFKKNVKLHFEGIEDCAICYSVISAIDRSTPQKKCRVCKHIFHGSCLFKWFKSSSQNTCPLCRQPF
ncbi:hypothetical protein HDV01_001258 [Terramyces sp. JEL0728]|nr:hypothetical protein HDV01_001258 [Terramyces sp. JEL0728]